MTNAKRVGAKEDASEVVKAALLINGADKQRYANLKDKLANNYLLGMDQYPNMFDKVLCILGNYQTRKASMPFRGSPNDTGVAFLQKGGRGG